MALKASVVIPAKNPGVQFQQVLLAVLEQKTPWQFDVLVVDSGSTDGTLEMCQSMSAQYPNLRVHRILAAEFGHGRTRNLGASLTRGEFIALITHDALPANDLWLANLVAAVEQAPDVAGAFGRHLPYPDASPYTVRDLILHFDGFLNWNSVLRLEDPQRYKSETGYRQVLHFFSDNNACIRRSVWEKIPYPDVDFAEDQIWAQKIIEAGYAKCYADNAAVFHSHDYSITALLRRSFDESAALRKLFDYRLCPSLMHLAAQSVLMTLADWRYSMAHGSLISHFKWMLASPWRNVAKLMGFYLGQRSQKLPVWLRARISLDQSIKAGR